MWGILFTRIIARIRAINPPANMWTILAPAMKYIITAISAITKTLPKSGCNKIGKIKIPLTITKGKNPYLKVAISSFLCSNQYAK